MICISHLFARTARHMARQRGFGPLVDDSLYVRAYNGQSSRWYQAAMRQKAGKITAAGLTKEVSFEPVIGSLNDRIDDAYRAKYRSSPYLKPMIGTSASSATVKVMPRE